MNLEQLLTLPEGKTLEFKKDLSSLKPILKTIIAFANTSGGTIIIGKGPNNEIEGIENVMASEEKLVNAISDSIYPPVLPEIEAVTYENKNLLLIRVSHWKGPFYLKQEGRERGVYIRLGSTSRPAPSEVLDELRRSLAHVSFDQQPFPDVVESELNMTLIKKIFKKTNRKINSHKLETLGVLVPYQNTRVSSIGGTLLFGKDRVRQRYFPDARVSCARFRGTDKAHFIDRFEVKGSIINAIEQVPKFIARNTRMAAEIKTMFRKDIPEYSTEAIRETLVNALVHADYSLGGMHTQVAIFSDRLEIQNPGMLPFGYTWDDFKMGISRVRNRIIVRVFHELNLMEEWGSGYRRITDACRKGGYPLPVWKEIGMVVRVTFFPHPMTQNQREIQLPKQELTPRQKEILRLLEQSDQLRFSEIKREIATTLSERTLRYDLVKLKAMGLLEVEGKGPATVWKKQ